MSTCARMSIVEITATLHSTHLSTNLTLTLYHYIKSDGVVDTPHPCTR